MKEPLRIILAALLVILSPTALVYADRSDEAAASGTSVERAALAVEEGIASWYGGKFQGRLTANGEVFDTNELTAAHRTLPFDSIVRVTSRDTDRSVIVRINDRGPFVEGRIIDLSRAAADAIGLTARGVGPVIVEILHLQEESRLRTVQVASFTQRDNARGIAERLRESGLSPVIESSSIGTHRVIIQGVPLNELDELRARLTRLGFAQILVRRK
jgi:rare lipoprotein A